MNRLEQYWLPATTATTEVASEVEGGRFQAADTGSGYASFVPLHYERNYAYPLIVWLHGAHDDERQLKRIMPFVSMRNYVAVAPRGIVTPNEDAGRLSHAWPQNEPDITQAEQRVLDAVASAVTRWNIARHRIFLAGYGCGGTMAFRLALNLPQVFAGALSLAGAFPTGHMPLAQLHQVRKLNFLLASGRDSRRYPPTKVCENLRLLYSAGISISLRQYPCGDDLTTHMLGDMDRWIMEQITGTSLASSDSNAQSRAKGSE